MQKVKLRNNVRTRLAKQMSFQFFTKMGNVGDDVMSSGRAFHVSAAATLNVLLPIVDYLNDGTTRRSVLAECRKRRPNKSETRTSKPM